MSGSQFFNLSLQEKDSEIFSAIQNELTRQKTQIELIASENIVSKAVLEAQGSVLTNKYAEGYPHKRYYGGCEHVDVVEEIAIERLKKLLKCNYANVQPHSGASANLAVMLAAVKPGETILGMSLSAGGHLTHGAQKTISGTWFNALQYGICQENGLIDYEQVEKLALEHRPKLIIAGTSSYPREIDWSYFRKVADKVGALLMVDMAHVAGLIAAGIWKSPIEIADVITSTTHKTLRGPRGGVILTNNEDMAKKINSSVFPGAQGGPLMHVIAAKAVAFGEALQPEYKIYIKNVVQNCQAMCKALVDGGLNVVTGGTDCHLGVVDLTPFGITGKLASVSLENAGLTCNKNSIPFDKEGPFVTSGIRIGSAAGTTRGFEVKEYIEIGNMIVEVLKGLQQSQQDNSTIEKNVRKKVEEMCSRFPIYS